MQVSLTAQGTPSAVIASIDAQVVSEKARLAAQHQLDQQHTKLAAGRAQAFVDAHARLEASAAAALDAVAELARTELADAPTDSATAVTASITIHRPDRAE